MHAACVQLLPISIFNYILSIINFGVGGCGYMQNVEDENGNCYLSICFFAAFAQLTSFSDAQSGFS